MSKSDHWDTIKFPLTVFLLFLLMAFWVGGGRILFGVFGWMAFITLFMFTPIILLYGTVLTIIVAVRQRSYRYRKWGPFMIWTAATLVSLFCVGFFMPDGGDTNDSIGSALSVVLMDRTNEAYIGLSGALAGWSIFTTIVSSIVAFALAFAERSKKTPEADAATPLKQTK